MKKLWVFAFYLAVLPALCFAEQIDINSATLSQLDELTGIGPTYAQRIIDNRPYSSVDDLLRVKGIGEKTLQKIKAQGFACVNCDSSQTTPQDTNKTKPVEDGPPPAPVVYASGVVFNEILPNPEGPDETNEWIEIYNQNDFEIDLSGWKIEDTEGTKTKYAFPENTKISAHGYLLLKRPETKITLNNSQDGLNLFWPDGEVISSIKYNDAPIKHSYNRTSSGSPRGEAGWQWSTTPTPMAKNIIPGLPNLKKSGNSNKIEAATAAVMQSINQKGPAGYSKTQNPWFLFLAALAITIISAAIVLFIKIKIRKNNVRT